MGQPEDDDETVAAAAILVAGVVWSLPRPAYHVHILRAYSDVWQKPVGEHEQGFLTSTGRFVDRFEAAYLVGRVGALYSEDLW